MSKQEHWISSRGGENVTPFFETLEVSRDETNSSQVNKSTTPPQTLPIIITSLFLDFADAVFSTPMVLSFLSMFFLLPLSFLSQGGIKTFFSPFIFFIQFIPGYAGSSHLDENDLLYIYGVFSSILFLAWSLLRVGTEKVLHAKLNFHFSFRTKLKFAILYFTIGCALLIIALVPKDPGYIFIILLFYVVFLISTLFGLVGHAIIRIFRNVLPKPEL